MRTKRKRKSDEDDKVVDCGYFQSAELIEEGHLPERKRLVPLTPPKDNDMVDRISKLSDDILQLIISFLTMREGAATAILSPRWRNLWKTSLSSLHFTDSNLFGNDYPNKMFRVKQVEFFRKQRRKRRFRLNRSLQLRHFKKKGFLEIQRTNFIRWVNQILKLPRASTINTFLVCFPLGIESASHLDRWMKLAAARGVRNLQLNFNWLDYQQWVDCDIYYKFRIQQFAGSSLNYLCLNSCVIQCPRDFRGINSLVSLSLTHCSLTGDNVHSILSTCPCLEFLNLRHCSYPDYTALKFVGPSISLKHLDIYACSGINAIELQDVNLFSFELQYPKSFSSLLLGNRRLSIINAPHLARLVLHMTRLWSLETLSNVPHLETLFLKHDVVSILPKLSAFNNLKRLVFSAKYDTSNLFEVLCFLEVCPLLQQLHVDMSGLGECQSKLTETIIATRPGCLHSNLKEVEIYEFKSHPEQIELAKYLLKNALVLEKMKLCTTCKFYSGHGTWTISKRTTESLPLSLDEVRKLLLKEKRVSTELLIVSA